MVKNEQFKILFQILKRFQAAGILNEFMLIGSWCLHFYRLEFENPNALPAFRTLDVDFLIPNPNKVKKEADVPELLKQEGFVPTYNRASGMVKYNHPELQVEFLVPELGRGYDKPQEIKKLHITAQGLRYLDLLLGYPRLISCEGLQVKVPEPAVFALHKLIVSARRLNQIKQKSDLETAIGLLDFLCSQPSELTQIQSVLRTIPEKWRKTILSISEKHYPRLNQIAKDI